MRFPSSILALALAAALLSLVSAHPLEVVSRAEEPSPSPTESEEPICFPASAEVETEDGDVKAMEDLKLGDRVKVAANKFSEVFMFTHKLQNIKKRFITLSSASGKAITLTSGHYIYINGQLAAARTAKVGDYVELADGTRSVVTDVKCSQQRGLFNPQTVHGDIIVDGIRASTYTTTVDPKVAHALLAPLRGLFQRMGISTSFLDAGADMVAKYMPHGGSTFAL